jgi:hypothetical protein
MPNDTIINALFDPLNPESFDKTTIPASEEFAAKREPSNNNFFTIRGADSAGQRSSANILLARRYGWRGYQTTALPETQLSNRITLTATDRNATIGTITVGLDDIGGLYAENSFPREVQALRVAGRRVCEFTKLAVDTETASKRVLASLFHVAYLLAYRIRNFNTLVIEVNPRHVSYYRRLLGCSVRGNERTNETVQAPAVLLELDLDYTKSQIEKFGGRPELAKTERSLYPFAFSAAEEAGIVNRLMKESWN